MIVCHFCGTGDSELEVVNVSAHWKLSNNYVSCVESRYDVLAVRQAWDVNRRELCALRISSDRIVDCFVLIPFHIQSRRSCTIDSRQLPSSCV